MVRQSTGVHRPFVHCLLVSNSRGVTIVPCGARLPSTRGFAARTPQFGIESANEGLRSEKIPPTSGQLMPLKGKPKND